jgi:hypothetical protein
MKHIQNSQISIGKSILTYRFKNLNKKVREPKVSRLLPNVCDFQNENHTLGYGFKNLHEKHFSIDLNVLELTMVMSVPQKSLSMEPTMPTMLR